MLLGFEKPRKKITKTRNLGFLRTTCIGWGRNQKTNEKPGRNPRRQKTKGFGLTFAAKKGLCIHPRHS
jgi:hypothetical protein